MAIPNGTKVISRTNNYEEPLIIGIVKADIREEVNCSNFVPLIVKEDGTEVFSFGITIPFYDLVYKRLLKLDGKRQWDFLEHYRKTAHPEANK
jgi:hypothetical protein